MLNLFFDTIIFTYLILAVLLIILLYREIKKEGQRKWHLYFLFFGIAASGLVIFYGSFIEPRIIDIKEENIVLKEKGQNVKIALIADIHVGPYKKSGFVKKVSEKLLELNPDIILIGGDNIFGGKKNAARFLTTFETVAKQIPVFAVSGNHEYNIGRYHDFDTWFDLSEEVKTAMHEAGVNYLENEAREIEIRGAKFWLLGIDSIFAGKDNLPEALKFANDDYPKIVLVHEPDLIKQVNENNYNVDLVVAGHTHGGQVRLPFIGTLVPLPTSLGRKYDKGLFYFGNTPLYITSGIGEAGTRARLFNIPEIVILNVKM